MEIFAVCVITFEPTKIQTCSSPQNDRQNLSFVQDIKVIGKKRLDMIKNGLWSVAKAIYESQI